MKAETIEQLVKELEIPNPELWKDSNFWELTSIAFLRQVWLAIPDHDEYSWLDAMVPPDVRENYERLIAAGAKKEDLLPLIRGMLKDFLHFVLFQLADPSHDKKILNQFSWGIWGEDGSGKPLKRLNSTHEHIQVYENTDIRKRIQNKL